MGATCTNAGCHTGTANNPANKGSVSVTFPNGQTYVPGVKQHLMVTIADPAATQQAWGFQLTARVSGTPSAMAGFFAFTDANTLLMCSQPNFVVFQALVPEREVRWLCPHHHHHLPSRLFAAVHGAQPHRLQHHPRPRFGNLSVRLDAAGHQRRQRRDLRGRQRRPDRPPTQNNDHIYTTTYTLTPSAGGNTPAITAGGVVSGASFQPGIVPGSWLTITGTNLSPVTDTWDKAIVNGQLPTALDGVSVNVGSYACLRPIHQPDADQRAGARRRHRTGARHRHHSQRHQRRRHGHRGGPGPGLLPLARQPSGGDPQFRRQVWR